MWYFVFVPSGPQQETMVEAGTKNFTSVRILATVVPEDSFADCERVAIFRAEKLGRGANLFAA